MLARRGIPPRRQAPRAQIARSPAARLADNRSAMHTPALLLRTLPALALGCAALGARAAAPEGWIVSPDGTWVVDERARLAWARCVEGMRWTGSTCAGQPELFTHGEAQARARQRGQAEGLRWRLPRVPELKRLAAQQAVPLPGAPQQWHWTGTASVNAARVNPYAYDNVARGGMGESRLSAPQGWAVDMGSGEARGDVGRGARLPLRLVRPAP